MENYRVDMWSEEKRVSYSIPNFIKTQIRDNLDNKNDVAEFLKGKKELENSR